MARERSRVEAIFDEPEEDVVLLKNLTKVTVIILKDWLIIWMEAYSRPRDSKLQQVDYFAMFQKFPLPLLGLYWKMQLANLVQNSDVSDNMHDVMLLSCVLQQEVGLGVVLLKQ